MSKKKIIILIIAFLIVAGLFWFFWPKMSYFDGGATNIMSIKDCKCLGIESKENKTPRYTPADGAFERYCYGIVYNCKNVK